MFHMRFTAKDSKESFKSSLRYHPLTESEKSHILALFAVTLSYQGWGGNTNQIFDLLQFLSCKIGLEKNDTEAYLPLIKSGRQCSDISDNIVEVAKPFVNGLNITYI